MTFRAAHKLSPLAWGDQNNRIVVCWQYVSGTEVGYPSAEWDYQVYQELVRILCLPGTPDEGLVPVTNCIPSVDPWNVVLALVFGTPNLPFRTSSGGKNPKSVCRNVIADAFNVVHVGWRATPEMLAGVIAHEAVHAFQRPDESFVDKAGNVIDPSHEGATTEDGSPNVMQKNGATGGKLSAWRVGRMKETIRRHMAGDRLGAYLPRQGGQLAFGWGNLAKVSFE